MNPETLERVRRLVGPVTREQLGYVDAFVGERMALFMPVGGSCGYAVSPDHGHPAYMFVVAFDRECRVALGRRIVDAEPGKIFALSPEVLHQELPGERLPRYVAVMVDEARFRQVWAEYGGEAPHFPGGNLDGADRLLPVLKRFMAEASGNLPGREGMLEALELEGVHTLVRILRGVEAVPAPEGQRVEIGQALALIHASPEEELSNPVLARAAGLSETHFIREFRRETGESPAAYLRRVRLELAKRLLRAGEEPLTEIARRCGYATPSAFTRSFSRRFGESPAAFRKRMDGGNGQENGGNGKAGAPGKG